MKSTRARSKHDPRACVLLRRPKIRHALLRRSAQQFYDWITCDALWPIFRARFPELARLIEHEDRATRSDLRESIALTFWALLSRCDLKSFRVGWRQKYRAADGRTFDFLGLPRKKLAEWTGLAESTASRACTLLRRGDLIAGPAHDGYNAIPQPVEECAVTPKTPNGVRGLAAIRRVFEHVFDRLGFKSWLDKLRNPPAAEPPATGVGVAARNTTRAREVVSALARALGPPPEPG